MPSEQPKMNEEEQRLASLRKLGLRGCPYCGNHEVYRSRTEPLTWLDRACGLFLLRVVRCHECELRHYRPVFLSTPEYPYPNSAKTKSATNNANDGKRRRSA